MLANVWFSEWRQTVSKTCRMTPVPITWPPFASPLIWRAHAESSKKRKCFRGEATQGRNEAKLIRLIFQMLLCQCVRWGQSKAKTPTRFAPLSLGCRKALLPNRRSAFIIHPSAAPSSPDRPITAALLRPLPDSFDAALAGFDVSIDTEEPRTEP